MLRTTALHLLYVFSKIIEAHVLAYAWFAFLVPLGCPEMDWKPIWLALYLVPHFRSGLKTDVELLAAIDIRDRVMEEKGLIPFFAIPLGRVLVSVMILLAIKFVEWL